MILRNGKVYISHTREDEGRYASLVAKLTQKQIDCWSTLSPEDSDSQLSKKTQEEIVGRDVFLRICTPAAARSVRMQLEAWTFGATQALDAQNGTPNQHIRIDLVMDTAYTPEPAQPTYLTIDAITRPMNDWLVVLYREMGRMQATQEMTRGTMTIIVAVCVILAFLLVLALLAFFVLFQGTGFFT